MKGSALPSKRARSPSLAAADERAAQTPRTIEEAAVLAVSTGARVTLSTTTAIIEPPPPPPIGVQVAAALEEATSSAEPRWPTIEPQAPPPAPVVDDKPHARVASQLTRGLLKIVPGHFVSNLGRVRRPSQQDSYGSKTKSGYYASGVHRTLYQQHKIVMLAFDGLPAEGETQVDHKNRNTGDNARENLEYVTPAENIRRSYLLNAERKSSVSKTSKPLFGRKLGTTEWVHFASISVAAKEIGLCPGSISSFLNEKNRTRVGEYEFKWAPSNERDLLPDEQWRDVGDVSPKMGKHAQVSSLGRFRNVYGVTTTPTPHSNTYCYVEVNGRSRVISILIAEAFELPRQPDQTEVDHWNGDPSDNRLSNLRYVTPSENVQGSHNNNINRKSNAEARGWPLFYRVRGTTWPSEPSFETASKAARQLGMNQSAISSHANKRWKDKSPCAINDKHEFMYQPRQDLPNEVWVPLLLPTKPATVSFQPFDPERVSVPS